MSLKNTIISAWETLPATIASGSSMTGPIDLGGLRLFAVGMPASWTSANLTFQTSPDGGTTWLDLYDSSGNAVTATAVASACILMTPSQFAPLQYLRIRSGTSSSPINQADNRQLQVILRTV